MATSTSIVSYGVDIHNPLRKTQQAKKKTLFYGLGFPVGNFGNKGFFRKQAGVDLVKGNLRQLLLTERGERVMLPGYGVSLKRYLFDPLDEITFNMIREEVQTSITSYIRNVEILRLNVAPLDSISQEGLQQIKVSLTVKIKEEEDLVFDVNVDIK